MSERDALLRHVIEHADDDAPRLVMADWLDERGEGDRAAFIRLQIARENDPSTGSFRGICDEIYPPAEAALLGPHADEWSADLPAWARASVGFRRGFAEDVHTTIARLHAAPKSLFRRTPLLGLSLDGSRSYRHPSCYCRDFGRLRRLRLFNVGMAVDALDHLTQALEVGRLRELSWIGRTGHGDLLPALLAAPFVRHLRAFHWDGADCTPDDVYSLSEAFEPGLVSLTLDGCRLSWEAVEIIANAPGFATLRWLSLTDNLLTNRAAEALAGSPSLGGLRLLDVRVNPIGQRGTLALLQRFGDAVSF